MIHDNNKIISISRQGNLKDIYKQKNYLVNDLTKDLDWTGAHRWRADGALEAPENFISFGDKKTPYISSQTQLHSRASECF